ncbi:UDP-N-acetyl-D-mannosamine dehydrogenase [Parasphingorhabdus sp.]|uniref:UDP-N-acetyl-D-mannosamine dehydrogenase n=1 Tax=Parasphingorhabdus sp. TaxID=2709688 RepID=UPI002F959C70
MQRISVLGLGYVGLPSAAVFADSGLNVIGVDIDSKAVETINSGKAHIIEPNLDDLLHKVVGNGSLRATTQAEKADVFVIAVPTPFKEGNQPDLRFVKSVADMIAPLLEAGNLVILESTSPVGATEQLAGWLRDARPDLKIPKLDGAEGDINLAYCPERILPGKVIEEVVNNDRVIGGMTPACSEAAVRFYKYAVKGECHVTNARTAELCKLSENSFRDVNIAFANELSVISSKLGVDVYELIALTNRHPRVNILKPGTGVGGHCIAVDPWFIVDSAPEEARIIRTAREVNDSKPGWVVDQVAKLAEGMDKPTIACMGLAYKPDVDDLRESPAVQAVKLLVGKAIGNTVVCEPFVDTLPESLNQSGVELMDANQVCDKADIIVFLTAHDQFRHISPHQLQDKIVFDACGLTK